MSLRVLQKISDLLPPWKDPATPHPPRSVDAFREELSRWKESLEGGGLWDFEQEKP